MKTVIGSRHILVIRQHITGRDFIHEESLTGNVLTSQPPHTTSMADTVTKCVLKDGQ